VPIGTESGLVVSGHSGESNEARGFRFGQPHTGQRQRPDKRLGPLDRPLLRDCDQSLRTLGIRARLADQTRPEPLFALADIPSDAVETFVEGLAEQRRKRFLETV
jgi:hypothetical protein